MKKILALFTALMSMSVLAGCSKPARPIQAEAKITGTVTAVYETYAIIHCESIEGYIGPQDCQIPLEAEKQDSYTDLTVGDLVSVYFDDLIAEVSPLCIDHILAIELVSPAADPTEWTEEEIIALFENSPTFFVRDASVIAAVVVTDFAYDMVGAVLCTLPERDESWVAFLDAEGNAYCNGIGAKIGSDPEFTYCGNGTVSLKLVTENGSVWTFRSSVCVQDDGISFKVEAPPEEP